MSKSCPFELPLYSEKFIGAFDSIYCVRDPSGELICDNLLKEEADYIVQAINFHEKLIKIKQISYEAICTGDQEASDKAIGLIEDFKPSKKRRNPNDS